MGSWALIWSDLHVGAVTLTTTRRVGHRTKALEARIPVILHLAREVLLLFSGDNLSCMYTLKLGPFLSLTACSNLQTNVSVSWYLVKPSWSTHLALYKFCFAASQQEGRIVFSQPSHWLLSFPGSHRGLGRINWSFPKLEESSSWNHKWSLPRNNNDGRKTHEEHHTRKHWTVKKFHSDGFRTAGPDVACGQLPFPAAKCRNGESPCWNVDSNLIQSLFDRGFS